jgi:hypothetical protein
MSPTVHVLLYGRVLCGNVHGLPCDWGAGHKWCRPQDWRKATCASCREQAERLAAEGRAALEQSFWLKPADDGEVE